MIDCKSVFIIGAGSSNEYGYPLWGDLSAYLKGILNQDEFKSNISAIEAKNWLKKVSDKKTLDQVIYEKNKIIRGKSDPSEVEDLIWKIITKRFFELEVSIVQKNISGWIDKYSEHIVRLLIQSYDENNIEDFDERVISQLDICIKDTYIITFNYDRILEYKIATFIFEKIKEDLKNNSRFRFKLEEKLHGSFRGKFFHPHGAIGLYQNMEDNSVIGKKRITAGPGFGDASLGDHISNMIATCFDCDSNSGSFKKIKDKNMSPETIYILGNSVYGLKNNLTKLPCDIWKETVKRVVCTSFDSEDEETFREIIVGNFKGDIPIKFYKSCSDFIENEIN